LLIESYGLDCYRETDNGLLFEVGFTNRNYMVSWLLSFGCNVKVIEPSEVAIEIQAAAKNILSLYS
jgi:predicted DNA-binding transcriptional regulator YafY